MKILLLFPLAFLLGSASDASVSTPSGPVQGTIKNINDVPVQVFLGIPYAEPPIGNLRFQKSQPVKSWTKTLDATKQPPACIQHTIYPFPWYDDLPDKSEDCLYLNIYTPGNAKKGSGLAVFFWIHGGGWLFGSNRMDLYDARAIVAHGDIIVVTINYRLGIFGFLTSNTTDAPGNVGMYDMYTALLWVNKNIESFGGDKKRITLVGESAGSVSISLFCVSPMTKGLFSRAIMESGSAAALKTNQLRMNLDISQQVAVAVGCASDDRTIESDPDSVVDCLKKQNASYLAQVLWSLNPTTTVFFKPQYGDDLFPSDTFDRILNGRFHNVPLLIGNNQDEGSFFITTTNLETFGFFGEKNAKINKTYANDILQKYFKNHDDPDLYVKYYLKNLAEEDYDSIKSQTYTAVGDNTFLCSTIFFAEIYAERNNDIYFYLFVHKPSNTPWYPWKGAKHFEEVQFVFGQPLLKPELYEADEIELSKKMIEVWTNFAKHGVPSYCFNWPNYSKEKREFVIIDTAFTGELLGTSAHFKNCEFLRHHFGFE